MQKLNRGRLLLILLLFVWGSSLSGASTENENLTLADLQAQINQLKTVQLKLETEIKSVKILMQRQTPKQAAELLYIKQAVEKLASIVQTYPKSCSEVYLLTTSQSKQKIYPEDRNNPGIEALCDFETDDGRWTIIQKRSSGPRNEFYRNWTEYENGFGSIDGNFWIGLKTIYTLTKDQDQELRIDLWDFEGGQAYAKYSNFFISNSSDFYRLSIGGFSGTSLDSITPDNNPHLSQNGMRFSTKDKDNDGNVENNCASVFGGAWWHNRCGVSKLNGFYQETSRRGIAGIEWAHWAGGESRKSLSRVEMKIRKRF